MRPIALDTSVVVAALLASHEHHDPARRAVEGALSHPGGCVVPVPVLLETYAVLTRLPAPWRVSAAVAERLLHDTFAGSATVVSLPDADAAWSVVRGLAAGGLTGGVAHDAHVGACAQVAGASALVTLGRRDFAKLDLGGMALVVP